mmetsp:Transcript_199/g.316  ORF Transcript_199/g.316 Transcript_199/m.316 type:complete len:210 (+) Transcript_199:1801-2430(+)
MERLLRRMALSLKVNGQTIARLMVTGLLLAQRVLSTTAVPYARMVFLLLTALELTMKMKEPSTAVGFAWDTGTVAGCVSSALENSGMAVGKMECSLSTEDLGHREEHVRQIGRQPRQALRTILLVAYKNRNDRPNTYYMYSSYISITVLAYWSKWTTASPVDYYPIYMISQLHVQYYPRSPIVPLQCTARETREGYRYFEIRVVNGTVV